MAITVNEAFGQYKSNLEITDFQVSLVSERRKNVVNALHRELTLHTQIPSKLIGSYDRKTMTRYLSEGDIDVMVVLHYGNHKDWDNPAGTIQALDRFRAILDTAYPFTEKRRDRNCITMQFSEFRLDIVPAFQHTDGYFTIPDSVRRQWVKTDPTKFASEISRVNANMDDRFVPLIKMVKGWNRENGWPIGSFHLESIMYYHCRSFSQGYTYSSMLRYFFEALPNYLAQPCYDPIMGDRLDTYLDGEYFSTRRQTVIGRAQKAAEVARKAFEEENYPPTAIPRWKSLLGTFFPNYG